MLPFPTQRSSVLAVLAFGLLVVLLITENAGATQVLRRHHHKAHKTLHRSSARLDVETFTKQMNKFVKPLWAKWSTNPQTKKSPWFAEGTVTLFCMNPEKFKAFLGKDAPGDIDLGHMNPDNQKMIEMMTTALNEEGTLPAGCEAKTTVGMLQIRPTGAENADCPTPVRGKVEGMNLDVHIHNPTFFNPKPVDLKKLGDAFEEYNKGQEEKNRIMPLAKVVPKVDYCLCPGVCENVPLQPLDKLWVVYRTYGVSFPKANVPKFVKGADSKLRLITELMGQDAKPCGVCQQVPA